MEIPRQFVVATPERSVCDENARALEKIGVLRFVALGTRRGTVGIPQERTRLLPAFGLANYIAAKTLPPYRAESFRIGMLPWFDRWVKKQLTPGDHIISSYGYVNECFKFVRRGGGKTFLDAGNSHIDHYWDLISEEHRRWKSEAPPFSPLWLERGRESLAETDFVLSPSSYVTNSFLARGFTAEKILKNVYPVDLSLFKPDDKPRPKDRPLTIINTGSLSLRKGTPYLLEAFAAIAPQYPEWILQLAGQVGHDEAIDQIRQLIKRHHLEERILLLGERSDAFELMQRAVIYVQPSFWEALGLALQEAMLAGCACIGSRAGGIPELVQHEQNGLLFQPGNVEQLAQALERLINNPGQRERLGSAAAASIRERKMTSQQMIESYLDLYQIAHPEIIRK